GAAGWHQEIERARDRTHVGNLAPGEMVDALVRAGLVRIAFVEEEFELDFDEWFDRGTPSMPKARVREMVESGRARGFDPWRRTTSTRRPAGRTSRIRARRWRSRCGSFRR